MHVTVFSIEVLSAVEAVEHGLIDAFARLEATKARRHCEGVAEDKRGCSKWPTLAVNVVHVVEALKKLGLLNAVVDERTVMGLVKDILPSAFALRRGQPLCFPQWEWLLCIIAFRTVEVANGRRDDSSKRTLTAEVCGLLFWQ